MGKRPLLTADPVGSREAALSLKELLRLASDGLGEQVTARTVRLYATEGLIDRPSKDGRRALYSQRHLLQLLLVRTLARRGLSLSAIAPLVVGSDDELLQRYSYSTMSPTRSHPIGSGRKLLPFSRASVHPLSRKAR